MEIAMVQMMVTADQWRNLEAAESYVAQAKRQGADLVVLPEMFVCPYDTACFPQYAQKQGDTVWIALQTMAKAHNIHLIGGSVPELEDGKVYNTSYVFDPQGNQIGKHRKIHLFDIDVAGGQYFKESDTLTAGDSPTVFDTPWGKVGVVICFDIRFPDLARQTVDLGAKAIFVPAAFNPTTGPAHWELLFRGRAVDNQCYTVGVSSACPETGYQAYGHSIAVSPWGTVLHQMDDRTGMVLVDLDMDYVDSVRSQIPLGL
ncbi:MAG: carbon-nitrogen hydrolase family protein [Eubacteriales bacterium]